MTTPSIPRDANDLLRMARDEIVTMTKAGVDAGYTGKTHLVAVIYAEGRWRRLLDRIAPAKVISNLCEVTRDAGQLPVGVLRSSRSAFVAMLKELDGSNVAIRKLIRAIERDPPRGRFHVAALHPDNCAAGQAFLHATEGS